MNLHEIHSKTRDRFPISARKILKKTIGATFALSILVTGLFIGFVLSTQDTPPAWISSTFLWFFTPLMLVALVRWVYELYYFKNYFYEMGPDYFVIRRGVFTTHELVILYNRIQDIYIDQDLLDSVFELYDVHISSATATSGWAAHVDGLTKAHAEGLRSALLEAARNAKH